jgi:adenylate cyclase
MNDVELLHCRALLARAQGDEAAYQEYKDRYLDAAKRHGFAGHLAIAQAMT